MRDWEPYDPTWLVELAREQAPECPSLPTALSKCTRRRWGGEACMYFVDDARPNEPDSEWQFVENSYGGQRAKALLSTPTILMLPSWTIREAQTPASGPFRLSQSGVLS